MRSSCMPLDAGRRVGALVLVAVVLSAVGCVDPTLAQQANVARAPDPSSAPPTARRSNVATPFITLTPTTVEVPPGAKVLLTAKPGGGEAMLFTVDWQVQEGSAGGTVEGVAARHADGTYTATYTAPADGAGPYHVTASLREYPAASAVSTIALLRR